MLGAGRSFVKNQTQEIPVFFRNRMISGAARSDSRSFLRYSRGFRVRVLEPDFALPPNTSGWRCDFGLIPVAAFFLFFADRFERGSVMTTLVGTGVFSESREI